MATTSSITTVTIQRQTTPPPTIVLHLRLPETQQQQPRVNEPQQPLSVRWDESVIDNEHMGKRKSKKCCIFHKQRPFDESESESESDDEGGWELDENGVPRWIPNPNKHRHADGDDHEGECGCGHSHEQ